MPEDQEPDPTIAVLDRLAEVSRWDPIKQLTGKRRPKLSDIVPLRGSPKRGLAIPTETEILIYAIPGDSCN